MATYKWLLIVYYLLLRVLCEANNEENWSEMVSMIRNKELCWSSCQNHELTFTTSNQTESNGTVSNYRNCQCDEECEDYGDCCYDAASVSKDRTVKKNNKDGSWACLPLRFKDNNYKLDEEYYIYMVGNCPVDWSGDETLPDLCHRKVISHDYSHLLDLPVFSNLTNVTYANIYCAICHSDAAQLASWDSWVECNDNLENLNINRDDIFNPSNYQPGLRRWSMLVNDTSVNCHLFVKQFQKYDNYLETTASRKCLPAIDNCAANWDDPAVKINCHAHTLFVETYRLQDKLIYKNPYCAQCNYVQEISCYQKSQIKTRLQNEGRYGYSFSMLIDFEFGKRGKPSKCGGDQIYDSLRNKCHPIVCGVMFDIKDGTCVPKNESQVDHSDWIGRGFLNSSCQRLNLIENQDFILENRTLILNRTGQRFLPEEYELTADGRNASICAEGKQTDTYFQYSEGQRFLSDICLAISVVCLALHIAIHAALPKLRNLPGKNLLSLSCALFIAQLLFLTGIGLREAIGYGFCAAMGILTHWSYLAAFFWMNVMGFDICRTFAGSLTRHRRMPGSGQRTTFRYYSLYAWGFPTLIVLLGISLDLNHLDEDLKPLYGNHNPSCWMDDWAPAYGVHSCWISNRSGLGIFFVVPVAVLLLENLILFSITVFSILKQRRAAKFALEKNQSYRKPGEKRQSSLKDRLQPPNQTNLKNSSSNNNNKQQIRFILYIKLGLIMGLGWIFGFAAALAKVPVLWYPFIFFNALQGAFIFVAFTCKRKVYYMMYYWATNEPHPNDTSSSSRATASSNKPSSSSSNNQRISYATSSSVAGDFESNRPSSVDIRTRQSYTPPPILPAERLVPQVGAVDIVRQWIQTTTPVSRAKRNLPRVVVTKHFSDDDEYPTRPALIKPDRIHSVSHLIVQNNNHSLD